MSEVRDPRDVIIGVLPAVAWAYVEPIIDALYDAGWALQPVDGSGGQFRPGDPLVGASPTEPLPVVHEAEAEPEGGRANVTNDLTSLSQLDLSNLDL